MAERNFKAGLNEVTLTGVLQEINLKVYDKKDGTGKFISGTVAIKTGDNSVHNVTAFANQYTKKDKPNPAYEGLETVINEYTSVASLLKEGKTQTEAVAMADTVEVSNGNLDLNEYYDNQDNLHSRFQIRSSFFHRTGKGLGNPKAEFALECYFDKIKKEIKNDEETGRIIVNAIAFTYGGKALPFTFYAEGDVADYIENNYEEKRTGYISGEIVNSVNVTTTRRGGFGKAYEKQNKTYVSELRITGGDEEQYDEDSFKSFNPKDIKEAMIIRETETLPALREKRANGTNNSNGKRLTSTQQEALKRFSASDFEEEDY